MGLAGLAKLEVSTDELLLKALDRRPLSSARAEVDAVPGRVSQAIERAAKQLEPKVRLVAIERATLRNAHDIEDWLDRQKTILLAALRDGPVLTQ